MAYSIKDRMTRSDPIWRRIVARAFGAQTNKGFVMQQAVAGAAAGNIAVSKIKKGDHLVSVIMVTATTAALTDLTSQFTITANAQINNTGGTSSASNGLIVTWEAFDDE
jgi:hypothetical protein